ANEPRGGDPSSQVSALALANNEVIVASAVNGIAAIAAVDVTDPHALRIALRYDVPGTTGIATLAAQGNDVYLADSNFGLRVLNLAAQSGQIQIGFYPEPSTTRSVSVQGNLCYLTGDFGTDVLDISDPSNPIRITGNGFAGPLAWLGNSTMALESSDS